MPIKATTPSGSSVTVITTTFMVPGIGSHMSSGYPTSPTSKTASTVLRISSMPPNSLPESV